jgi:hypothetical protein
MARFIDINCPSKFDTHGDTTSLGTRWQKWRQGFDLYLVAAGIIDSGQKKALLLHCGGEDLRELYDTLPQPIGLPEDANDYVKVCAALDIYFLPKKNKRYERHFFRICVQKEKEPITQYVTRLRALSKTCEFTDANDEIVDQVIEKCISRKLRKRLLKEQDLDLQKLCGVAAIMEAADHQAEQYQTQTTANNVKEDDSDQEGYINRMYTPHRRPRHQKSGINAESKTFQCFRCGAKDHLANACEITKGKTCRKCGKPGHFANVCRSTTQTAKLSNTSVKSSIRYMMIEDTSSDEDFVLAIQPNQCNEQSQPITINGKTVSVLIDSGSTANVISKETIKAVGLSPELHLFKRKIFAFGGSKPLPIHQSFMANIAANNITVQGEFIVNEVPCTTILGQHTATLLDLLRVGPPADHINSIEKSHQRQLNELMVKYKDRFEGLGKLKEVKLKIYTKNSIKPIAQKARRLPFLMKQQVDKELDRLLELKVIEPVPKPPTWVNPIVVVPKKDSSSIRMCVDMRAVNEAIIREPFQIPTLEEVIHDFNGCTVFTKLDLNKGYHQIELDEESRDLTAFATHRGIFRYTRLLFGMSSAAEIYQREIEHALAGILQTRNISDDIIIGGRSVEELLIRTEEVLQRLREKNLTVNPAKCEFIKPELIYMGHKLSAAGIDPDERKVKSIQELAAPANQKELRSFLGLIIYCSKFLPNFATITEPLRQLLRHDASWEWTSRHQVTFESLKETLLSTDTLAYFDPNLHTEIITDASPVGLGAVLMQKQADDTIRPVTYASRALTKVEQRYSQIERECLAIIFAIERFRQYLYGMHFTVRTDHKPLVHIFSSSNKIVTPRIERLIIRSMPYNFEVKHQPGATNPADFLSRSNPVSDTNFKRNMIEDYVNFIFNNAIPISVPIETIREEQ